MSGLPFASVSKPSRKGVATSPTPSTSSFLGGFGSGAVNNTVVEKHQLLTGSSRTRRFFTPYAFNIPYTNRRVLLPLPTVLHPNAGYLPLQASLTGRSGARSPRFILTTLVILAVFLILGTKFSPSSRFKRLPFQGDPSTLVISRDNIGAVWRWEMLRGHYPSHHRLPTVVDLGDGVVNPGLPSDGRGNIVGVPKRGQIDAVQPPPRFPEQFDGAADTVPPTGPLRSYLNISHPHQYFPYGREPSSMDDALKTSSLPSDLHSPYPPRPVPDSIIDLDIVLQHCDFSTNQYVRDCLEVLRTGASLDPGKRVRRGKADSWRHIYLEEEDGESEVQSIPFGPWDPIDIMESLGYLAPDSSDGGVDDGAESAQPRRHGSSLSTTPPRRLRTRVGDNPHPTHPTADPQCSPHYPRIFHIFWAGPFTDKPYLALLSFLYTQNLGLHLPSSPDSPERQAFLEKTCRPQVWVWINPGPAAAVPNPNARTEMFDSLKENPWSRPFLHPRFKEVIKFKMWNTTEQLDGVPELRNEWRNLALFNSGGVKYESPPKNEPEEKAPIRVGREDGVDPEDDHDEAHESAGGEQEDDGKDPEERFGRFGNVTDGREAVSGDAAKESKREASPSSDNKNGQDDLLNRVGSTSASGYDRLSVVLSDMARFVLCHRFGGIYLDADTILLRDWEELWGWKGAFAYRWSRLDKYNTAVLKLHRNSALGSFLFKTALANGLDFHPMTISRYTKDADVKG
jgi:WD repeat and SOF domain-containing protein 1